VAFGFVPLALWGLERALAGSAAGGAWCGLALLALAVVEPHFFYFAALGLPLYLVARLGLAGWRRGALAPGVGPWALALAVAAAPALGALAALRRQGWTAGAPARVAVAATITLAGLALWQAAAGALVAAGVAGDPRAAARRSLLGLLPWLAALAAAHPRGRPLALAGLLLPAGLHLAWLARHGWAARPAPGPLGLAALGAAAGTGYLLAVRALAIAGSVAGAGRSLHEVLLFSPTPADLLQRVNPAAGRTVYPGLAALALAALGTAALARRPPAPARRVLLAFAPLLALAVALSLGPRLGALPLFEVAFRLVPAWGFIRQPAKLQVLAGLALAVLAAAGVEALARRAGTPRRALLATAAAALVVAAEYHPARAIGLGRLPDGGPAYDTMRGLGARALHLPLWPGDSSFSALYLYTTTLTRVAMLNGYSALIDRAYVADVFRALEPLNLGVVREEEYEGLRRYGVRQVVLDRDAFPAKVSPFGPAFTLAGLQASPYLERVDGEDAALRVFRVRDEPGPPGGPPPRSPLGIYWEAESLSRDTGRVVEAAGASNGRVVEARAGRDRPGFLAFGPYRLLPPGRFVAVFRLRGAGAGATLQVATDRGRRVLGEREVEAAGGAPADLAVPFFADALVPVEYRVRWNGQGDLAVDAIAVRFADVPDPPPAVEVEALWHELEDRADPEASGGRAGRAAPDRTPRDQVWQGPLRRWPAGRYRLWVRLKLEAATPRAVAWCGARAASGGPQAGGRELAGSEAPAPGRYAELAVPFALEAPAVLELPCAYRGGVGVWFDRLRVEGPLSP
jgi:hypothetical protein